MISTIETCAKLIKQSSNILVLTGAGMSTASGIPDFRSKEGLYKEKPETILSLNNFEKNPLSFYDFFWDVLYYPEAKPNKGHEILAKWEQENRIQQLITQNVDGLHEAAGSQKVINFHGNLQTFSCLNRYCKKEYTIEEMLKRKEERPYYCECEGTSDERLLRPNLVFYGEMGYWFTPQRFHALQCMAYDADLILILGTGMSVHPFASIPLTRNQDQKTPIVIINQGITPLDQKPHTYVVREDISSSLEKIDSLLR